ncbi:MAG: endolytic transglycosylase MltG [Patescibacteria group bacterium]|nr:endolytic transglycosylase MltG [Patescibacteria group bacterium]
MKKLFTLAIIIIAALAAFFWFVPAAWISFSLPNTPNTRIEITEGLTADRVADLLVEKGIIASAFKYKIFARINSDAGSPMTGEYDLKAGMNFKRIARILALGPVRKELSVRIIEGWTIYDIEKALIELGVEVRPSDFLAERFEDDFEFLKDLPKDATLEGYLYPDTYRVWEDELPDALFRRQLQEFRLKTVGYDDEAKRQGRTFHDIVILASIVEKEARHDEDRPIISGIFMNRLNIGMALQSDATLNYVTRSGRDRGTAEDLANESPYNSYKYRGLPPGPIGNPGKPSLDAAMNPTDTAYWYFLTDEDGKAYFARTLDEHSQNRYKAF